MFWITPKIYCNDQWFRKLPPEGMIVFGLCTSWTTLRTDLPGLLNTTPVALAEQTESLTVEFVKLGLMQLCLPDKNGLQHFFFDADARVMRIPHLPQHQKAANENVIRGWFRRWRDIPDCRLKFDHIESLLQAVNLQNPAHERVWGETFGPNAVGARQLGLSQYSSVSKQTSVPIHTGSVSGSVSDPVCVSVSDPVGGVTHAKPTNLVEFPKKSQKGQKGPNSHGTRPAELRGHRGDATGVTSSGAAEPAQTERDGGESGETAQGSYTLGGNYLPPGFE